MSEELKGEYKPIWDMLIEIGTRLSPIDRALVPPWLACARMMPVNVDGIRKQLASEISGQALNMPDADDDRILAIYWRRGFLYALELALGTHAVEQLCKEED